MFLGRLKKKHVKGLIQRGSQKSLKSHGHYSSYQSKPVAHRQKGSWEQGPWGAG